MTDVMGDANLVKRRIVLKFGAAGAAALVAGVTGSIAIPDLRRKGLLSADGLVENAAISWADAIYTEVFPTSPLIVSPFVDALRIPKALAPTPTSVYSGWGSKTPGPGAGQQNSIGNETHQIYPGTSSAPSSMAYVEPLVYVIKVQLSEHAFTTSKVLPINFDGQPTISFGPTGTPVAAGTLRDLPKSTIYSFNGTFPGSMINAEYGKPAMVRFENHLDENPLNLDRQDFGSPDWSFLTHLHNGHTAPESDGNPHYSMTRGPKHQGYMPGQYVDNLYLNWPAAGDSREKQSFFWFHDHRMDQTGSNVYKGMVGLFPIYDPENNLDMGDETKGLRLPGVRTNNPDGSFDVAYDVPLAFFDCRLDDGVTLHNDIHDGEFPLAHNPNTHPEWWGKTFYKHFPNHGFIGDIFAVNGTAYPVMEVKRRKYRFRFLDCSISRIYEFKLMTSTQGPKTAVSLGLKGDDLQGQYRIPDGQQCMKFTQIASDGGLLQFPVVRDSFELWPAKRREFIVDFTKYMSGDPTTTGDEIYLTNVMKMPNGRMWTNSSRFSPDPNYKVPVLKFKIGELAPDNSVMPSPTTQLRALPPIPGNWKTMMADRKIFEVQRGSAGGEIEWLINGVVFDPTKVASSLQNPAGKKPLAQQPKGSFALWEIRNGGGGWVHPFHLHMEEHRTMMRNGKIEPPADAGHPDDWSREDLVALDPGESTIIYRGFRDFVGPYVAHCHNLAHEDHAMMFGWEITP